MCGVAIPPSGLKIIPIRIWLNRASMLAAPVRHTSFFIIKELTSLCYGLGLDLVHPDVPFQSIREKSFKRESSGWQTLDSAVSFFVIWRAR